MQIVKSLSDVSVPYVLAVYRDGQYEVYETPDEIPPEYAGMAAMLAEPQP